MLRFWSFEENSSNANAASPPKTSANLLTDASCLANAFTWAIKTLVTKPAANAAKSKVFLYRAIAALALVIAFEFANTAEVFEETLWVTKCWDFANFLFALSSDFNASNSFFEPLGLNNISIFSQNFWKVISSF